MTCSAVDGGPQGARRRRSVRVAAAFALVFVAACTRPQASEGSAHVDEPAARSGDPDRAEGSAHAPHDPGRLANEAEGPPDEGSGLADPFATVDLPTLRQAQSAGSWRARFARLDEDTCPELESGGALAITEHRLEPGWRIVELRCVSGAYVALHAMFSVVRDLDADTWTWHRLDFEACPPDAAASGAAAPHRRPTIANPTFDATDRSVVSDEPYRGLGDCGAAAHYVVSRPGDVCMAECRHREACDGRPRPFELVAADPTCSAGSAE